MRRLLRTLTVLGAFFVVVPVSAASQEEEVGERASCPGPETIATPEAGEAAPFTWPAPLPREPTPILAEALRFVDWSEVRARLVTDLYRRSRDDLAADLGDALLMGPELLLDETFTWLGGLSGRPSLRTSEEEEARSVTSRILEIQFEQRHQRIFAVFMKQWAASERGYLGQFQESRANTFGFQNRTEDADLDELVLDQRKVFWNSLRRTYLARYKVHSEEQIHNEAWYFDRWRGIDFAVLPPFIGAYLYYRGLDKRISLGETALRINFEPVSELRDRNRDCPVAAALEWTVKGFPVGIIVSAGLYDGRYELDFAGIGTSIGAARGAVQGEHGAQRR